MSPFPDRRLTPRGFVAAVGLLALSLLSCGREVTGPGAGVRFATGLSFIAEFPGPLASVAQGAGSVIPFERVRVVFRRSDGSVALDTLIAFPSNADSVALSLSVPLSPTAPSSGEPMTLSLAYVNAQGDTVFRGGPIAVTAQPRSAGSPPPPPASVPLTYVGPGATAASVAVAVESTTVVAGDPFTVTATAYDGQGTPMTGVPLVYAVLDPAHATLNAPTGGTGVTTALRGSARVRVQLPTGADDDTATIVVLPRAGALSVISGGGQTAAPLTTLPQNVSVRLLATDGQPLANAPITVTATVGVADPASGVTDAVGVFSFTWTLGGAPGAQSVTVSSPGVPNLVVGATATQPAANQLRITQQVGANYLAGDSIGTLLVEARLPGATTLDPTYADSVFLGFAVAPGGATITGVSRVRAVAGIATFNDFRLPRAGTYRLLVTAPALNGDTSATVTVAPRAASVLALATGGGQQGAQGAPLAQPVVVLVTDVFGNPVAGVAVGFTVASGSVSAPSVQSDAAGLASVTWTLGPVPGTQVLTATADGLAGSPLAVNATATSGIVTTAVTPLLDTLTAIGATRTLTATSRDAGNTVVGGSYTWSSRDDAVATVSAAGLVTAVTNGATWVDVVEAGGTRDSARIVVEQRLATIRVTPDPRDIYLGASFGFAAQAVDGRNVPLATQPGFTWSVGSTAIASVTAAGVATGVGLGTTTVRATAGAVTGVATLNVRTPITRIAVVRDSATFVATDTFSLDALDRTRSYRAVAYDTLDAVMTGIAFTWGSSNPSVAALDSTGAQTARARAVANGFTAIRASAQGVTGAAALTVQQVMTAVELSPGAVQVAPTGSIALTARRRDANGYFIPGGSFTYASQGTGIATISASGVVTGIAIGATTVTATSGTITSAPVTVTVTEAVPAILSFGRDTLAIGRSATNVPIPVYLSRPNASAVTVNLAVADTFAFFNPVAITIPAGNTVGTANLNGRAAGTTRVFAVDGGTTGYAGDTSVLAVQASVRFNTTSYSLLVNDEAGAQVQLTDPAPTGGTYITYTFGTAGRASVSPDPAFIPAGQLSANVVIRGLAAGSTTVTPAATGVTGTSATINVTASTLTMYRPTARIGAGQYRNDWYVYSPLNVNLPVGVTLTSTDTSVATVAPALATIPGGNYYVYFTVIGRAPGTATIGASATGWAGTAQNIIVTTPRLDLVGGGTTTTTAPEFGTTVYTADSTFQAHSRSSALAITVSSSDPSVLTVVNPSVTIGSGQYYTSDIRLVPGGTPGTAWIRVSASGHEPDSVQYTVNGPNLRFTLETARVGAGQYRPNGYVYTPFNVTAPLVVRLTSSDPAVATVPDSVIIPAGTYYAYYLLRGLAPGTVRINVSAAGYNPDSANFTVTSPALDLAGGGTVTNFSPPVGITTYMADSLNGYHYRSDSLIVSYTSSNPAVVTVTAADTVAPGAYFANRARVTIVGEGSAWVRVTAPGHRPDSVLYNVVTPRIQFSFTTYTIGRRQYRGANEFYVYTPTNVPAPLSATITQTNAAADSLSATALTIPGGTYYAYFTLAGLQNGVDTLIVSAPGYLPDTAFVRVTSPRLYGAGLPGSATTTTPPTAVTVYLGDTLGGYHYSLDTLLFSARSSNDAVLQPDSVGFRLPRGAYFVQPRVRWVGPGTANVTYADSLGTAGFPPITSNTATVTGPSLGFVNSYQTLGMRQYRLGTGAYVTIPNPIATPLVVNLISTDPTVATVPASVTIPAGQTFAYVDVRAQDVVGTVQLQASAVGYGPANTTQQVTAPRFVVSTGTTLRTTQTPPNLTIYAADAAGNVHYVWEPVTVQIASSSTAAATVDSASVTIPAGGYYNNNARVVPVAPGTTRITVSDPRVESYRYGDAFVDVAVILPTLFSSWGSGTLPIGIGQWVEPYVYTSDNQATALTVTLTHLSAASGSPASVTIPAGTYYAYHRITGLAAGIDSITYAAAGHVSVRPAVSVGLGRVDGIGSWPATLATDSVLVTLYARDPAGNVRNVAAATTFGVSVSGGALEVRQGGTAVTSVTIPADAQYVQFYLRRIANGTATVTFTNANYVTHVAPGVTVTGAP